MQDENKQLNNLYNQRNSKHLAKRFKDIVYSKKTPFFQLSEQDKGFISAMRALSNFELVEQGLIKKDNKISQENNEPRDFDEYGNPRPGKNEVILKYRYNKEELEIIKKFLNKIKFNSTPVIGKGKRVVIVFNDGKTKPKYSENESHPTNIAFRGHSREWTDMIYLIDKIKDLIMHLNNNYETNYIFKDKKYEKICIKQHTEDFSLDCEINIKDLEEFCKSILKQDTITTEFEDFYTYAYLCLLSSDMGNKIPILSYTTRIQWDYYNKEYIEILEKIIGIDYNILHANPEEYYLINILKKSKKLECILKNIDFYNKQDLDFNQLEKNLPDYVQMTIDVIEELHLSKYRYNSELKVKETEKKLQVKFTEEEYEIRLKNEMAKELLTDVKELYTKTNSGILGLMYDNDYSEDRKKYDFFMIKNHELRILNEMLNYIALHNRKLIEAFRNSRSHATHVSASSQTEMIQMDNKLINSHEIGYGMNSIPSFIIRGFEEDMVAMLDNIREGTSLKTLQEILQNENHAEGLNQELSNCIDQIFIILLNAKKYSKLTEKDIDDPELLERYKFVGKYAEFLTQIKIHEYIKSKIEYRKIQEELIKSGFQRSR